MSLEYDFNQGAQLSLLALFVREPELAMGIIEPRYFTNPFFAEIARIAKEAYTGTDLEKTRLKKDSLRALVAKELKEHRRPKELKKSCMKSIRKIFQISLVDRAPLLNLARDFAKQSQFRHALIKAEKDINNGRYETATKRFTDLGQLLHPRTSGVTLPVYPIHRLLADGDDPEGPSDHLVQTIVPKGGAVLLYGLPKELKSWFGAALVIDAASGRKVLDFFPVERQIRCLYVQIEDPHFLTRDRLRDLFHSQGLKKPYAMLKVIIVR